MTKRERLLLLWIRDFIDDAMGAADDYRFLKRASAAKRLVVKLAGPSLPTVSP